MRIKYIDFLIISALFLVIFLPNLPLASVELMQPDGCGYLDMGRNLFSGKGAVISYNLNQYWPGKYHPFLPYMQPVYGVIAGLIWLLFGLKTVIGFNIALHAVNCVLLYLILRIFSDRTTSLLIALFMGFSKNLIFPAMAPLTEPLHLLFLLSAILIYLKYRNANFWVGAILALSCLVKASSFYSIFAFAVSVIILKGFSKESFRGLVRLAIGFLAVFLTYELFCYIKYGAFYPQYLAAAKTYKNAETFAGAFYRDNAPVLNMPSVRLGMNSIRANIHGNFTGFIKSFGAVKYAMLPAPLFFIYELIKKRSSLVIIFFVQGFCLLFGYTLLHSWSPIYEFDRFSVISLITLGSVGFLSLKEIINSAFSRMEKRAVLSAAVFAVIFFAFFYFQVRSYLSFRSFAIEVFFQNKKAYRENRDGMYEWIRKNTETDALIASQYLADAFLFDRPFVSLPPGETLIEKNLIDFLDVYKPDHVLTYDNNLANYLKGKGFSLIKQQGTMILLENHGL